MECQLQSYFWDLTRMRQVKWSLITRTKVATVLICITVKNDTKTDRPTRVCSSGQSPCFYCCFYIYVQSYYVCDCVCDTPGNRFLVHLPSRAHWPLRRSVLARTHRTHPDGPVHQQQSSLQLQGESGDRLMGGGREHGCDLHLFVSHGIYSKWVYVS